ncbi:hypothetical protein Ssi03_02540 [Sphaerisporangium siamense]|uniref:ABC-2 type transport system permease protein n=1 Tax=Sphaerisporangium siamense TaxID=795645 RepID=A0A7W7GCE6_9ACTN|nr:ABC transporter permease subunit [Sphaerisporangium siamense]MBB4703795.1 ABC-2 type transport system permease protein [Sphaerisporangium siamense]GII82264.1 hypothetical protein Ssi03_02540 [Sphaerisporangium siamense]
MRGALHGEWTKLRTLAGPAWLSAAAALLTVAVGAVLAATVTCSYGRCGEDAVKLTFGGVQAGQVFAVLLAVGAVCGEYGTGMIRATLAATPRRGVLLAAKALPVAGLTLAAGTAAVLGCALAGRLLLPGRGYPALSLADGATLRAAAGTVLYLVLVALLALGVGAAVREAALSAGVVLGLLYLLPLAATLVSDQDLRRTLWSLTPMNAGLAVQATRGLDTLPLGPWAGLGVLACWSGAALLVAYLLLRRRDA